MSGGKRMKEEWQILVKIQVRRKERAMVGYVPGLELACKPFLTTCRLQ